MKLGISGKLVLCLVLTAMGVVVAIALMHYHAGRLAIRAELAGDLSAITQRLTVSLEQPVYEFDAKAIRDTLLAEFHNEDVAAVVVWSHQPGRDPELLCGLGRSDRGIGGITAEPTGADLVSRRRNVFRAREGAEPVMIGEVSAFLDKSRAEGRLLANLARQSLESALVVAALVLLLAFVANRYVVRPLEQLRRAMATIESAQDPGQTELLQTRSPISAESAAFRELRYMGVCFDRMVEAIRARQAALQESEALLKATGQIAKVGGWELDAASREVCWTEETYRIHEVEPGRRVTLDEAMEFFHPEDRVMLDEAIQRALSDGDPCNLELRFITATDRPLWVQVVGTPGEVDGRIVKVSGTLQDVTDRKCREDIIGAELRLSGFALTHSIDDLLQAFLDETERLTGSEIGFYHFVEDDQETLRLQAWSTNTLEKLCKAEGKGSHYAIDKAGVWVDCVREGGPVIHNDYASLPHRKGMPPGHAPVIRELVVPVYRGEKIVAILGVGNKKTDYVDADVRIVSDLANMAWDIVGRKLAEEALQASEAMLNETQAIAGVGSWERDFIGDRFLWSDETYRILGLSPEHFVATYETFLSRVHPDDRAAVEDAFTNSIKGGQDRYEIEHRIVRKDTGAVRDVRQECRHERDDSGRVIRSVGMIQDITERKRDQEELTRSNELKGKFIQVAGHELRTPLSYIMAVPKLMERVEDAGKLKEAIHTVEAKARRLSDIVQSMFKLMPEEDYSEALNLEDVHLPDLLEWVRVDCLPFVDERRQELIIRPDGDLPMVRLDPNKIHDVIENLIGNAVKFTPEGGQIDVAAAFLGDQGVQITVTDQGPGISPRDLSHIFTPFYSTDDVMKHSSGSIGKMKHGMGLGLTVVKHFTEMHGGAVDVTTSQDGSAFTITLPLSPPAEAPVEEAPISAGGEGGDGI